MCMHTCVYKWIEHEHTNAPPSTSDDCDYLPRESSCKRHSTIKLKNPLVCDALKNNNPYNSTMQRSTDVAFRVILRHSSGVLTLRRGTNQIDRMSAKCDSQESNDKENNDRLSASLKTNVSLETRLHKCKH